MLRSKSSTVRSSSTRISLPRESVEASSSSSGEIFAGALPDFELAARKEPNNAVVLDRLGQAYVALDRPAEALPALRRAAELAPADSKILPVRSRRHLLSSHWAMWRSGIRNSASAQSGTLTLPS
jgi:hypothetical protein